jgi:hypothetical protein
MGRREELLRAEGSAGIAERADRLLSDEQIERPGYAPEAGR